MTMIEGLFASNVLEAKLPYEPVRPSVTRSVCLSQFSIGALVVFHGPISRYFKDYLEITFGSD